MALIIMLGVGLAMQAAMLYIMAKPRKETAVDPLDIIAKARALGVRKLRLGSMEVEIEPPPAPLEPYTPKTPEERRADDEALLLHSVI